MEQPVTPLPPPRTLAPTPAGSPRWARGMEPLLEEQDYEITGIVGEVPAALQGTLFRVGPVLFTRDGRRLEHWFDGDGMIHAIRFDGGRAFYRNRFIRTPELLEEARADRFLYAGYGTRRPGGFWRNIPPPVKNAANTSVVVHGGKLLALWEGGLPTRIDPASLATLGQYDYGGRLSPKQPFSAHPRIDPITGEMFNFSVDIKRRFPVIHLLKVSPDGVLERLQEIEMPFPGMVHDFAITERHIVFAVPPFVVRALPLLLGFKSYSEALQYRPELGTVFLVVSRATGEVRRLKSDPFFFFHIANAFDEDGDVVIDIVRYPDGRVNDYLGAIARQVSDLVCPRALHRYHLHLGAGGVSGTQLCDADMEFPSIDRRFTGRYHRHIYLGLHRGGGGGDLNFVSRVGRFDVQSGRLEVHPHGDAHFAGEPVFVPRHPSAAEGDGWLLTVVYDAERHASFLDILEAHDLAARPVARLALRRWVPHGFHGTFMAAEA